MTTYYSSTDCVISIGTQDGKYNVISDIFSLQFGEQEQVMPVYSWNQKFFHHIGSGNILVSGTIIFNSLYPNYIERLANGFSVTKANTSQGGISRLQSNLKEGINKTLESGVVATEELLQLARLQEKWELASDKAFAVDDVYNMRSRSFSLRVESSNIQETIIECRLTGKATEVNAGDANNIKYAQPFIAQKIEQQPRSIPLTKIDSVVTENGRIPVTFR